MIKVSKLGVSGDYLPEFFSGTQSVTLSTGNNLILTPPAGKYLKLEGLRLSSANSAGITDISVVVGNTVVISELTLGHSTNSGSFIVGVAAAGSESTFTGSMIPFIRTFEPDQSITISRNNATPSTVYYSYSYGDLY